MLSENIARFRRAKSMTQEALGNCVGVSMQAVSKWENGGVPDTMLLPAIADALEVSIDDLFGRGCSARDVEAAIAQMVHDKRGQMPYSDLVYQLVWAMQLAHFTARADDNCVRWQRVHWQQYASCHSQDLVADGIVLMKLDQQLRYAFALPKPEKGWFDALQKEKLHSFFQLLAEPDFLTFLLALHSWENMPFTAGYAEKMTGIASSRITELMQHFKQYDLVFAETLQQDDKEVEIYTPRKNPALLPLLIFALECIDPPQKYCYQNGAMHSFFD